MIAKVRKGSSFTGLIGYLTKDGRGRVLSLRNLSSETPDEAASEMVVAAAQSSRTTRPVMHISVSYAKSEKVSFSQMRDDAVTLLTSLGLNKNQAVIIAHDDKDHSHFHIASNRVGADGRAVSDGNSYAKTEATLRKIEAERGWSAVEGRHAISPQTLRRMTGPRQANDAYGGQVPEEVKRALRNAESWCELHREIQRSGWRLSVVQKGKGSGALLTGPEGQKIGAGTVDRSASLTQLRRRLGRDPAATRKAAMQKASRELTWAARSTLIGVTAPFLNGGHMPSMKPSGKTRRKANPFYN